MIIEPIAVLGLLGFIFGAFLSWASKKFKPDEEGIVKKIRDVLPGVNCGACGFAGCDEFAKAVVEGKAKYDGCLVGKKEVADKIAEILTNK